MPTDMALPLYLSSEDLAYRAPPPPELSSCLRFQPVPVLAQPEPGAGAADARKAKKQVTFADQRGGALTRVKVFSQLHDPIVVPPGVRAAPSPAEPAPARRDVLVLDFAPPASDYLRFRQSLDRNQVCLERCELADGALAGTVRVRNVCFEKAVKLRVTFDTWRSHSDVACAYVGGAYPGADSDTFGFRVALPGELPPHERLEFAVCFRAGGREHWDSNHGNNYRVVPASARTSRRDACSRRAGLDRYGSPTCSHGLFPDWPSYAGYEHLGPYY